MCIRDSPYLVSIMGASYIIGLQDTDFKKGVMATAKHFVGYGASEGGMNWACLLYTSRCV